MSKIRILSVVLASAACVAAPAMAEDSAAFHAFSQMPSALSAMPQGQLASIEGGQSTTGCVSGASGGLIGIIPVNALNCNNIAVVVPINACVNVLIGACAGAQSNQVTLSQTLASIFN